MQSKHVFYAIGILGGGFIAYRAFQWWQVKKANTGTTGVKPSGFTDGRNPSYNDAVNAAANDSTGSGSNTNEYDAAIGIANIVGGIVDTLNSDATGGVADSTSDVVDRAASLRAEAG